VDAVDRALLDKIQTSFPLSIHPYREIGLELNISEIEAWQRVDNLKKSGIIRRIGGIFDSRRLGYVSTLCAAKVSVDKIPVLKEMFWDITEITHNYLRNHMYNMWFTVIACSKERLEEILTLVRTVLGNNAVYSLPAIKVFKIAVHFNLTKTEETKEIAKRESPPTSHGFNMENDEIIKVSSRYVVTEQDKALIRQLQGDLPDSLYPFSDLAVALNIEAEQVIEQTIHLLRYNVLRRLGAVLVHHKAGYTSNAMGVWRVPEEMIEEAGSKMSEFTEVSHCYQRPTLPGWPYNLFTMIHGHSDKECEEIMEKISDATKLQDYRMLFSQTELKKSSMRYFMEKNI